MNVSLTPQLERYVQEKVQSGRYNSASEVVREALRLMEDHERIRAEQLREFRTELDRRLMEADRGEGVDGDTFMQGLRDDLDDKESKRRAG